MHRPCTHIRSRRRCSSSSSRNSGAVATWRSASSSSPPGWSPHHLGQGSRRPKNPNGGRPVRSIVASTSDRAALQRCFHLGRRAYVRAKCPFDKSDMRQYWIDGRLWFVAVE